MRAIKGKIQDYFLHTLFYRPDLINILKPFLTNTVLPKDIDDIPKYYRKLEFLKFLRENDCNVPELPITPESEDQQRIKLLICKGEDINARDNFGRTPLHYAAKVGLINMVELEALKGVDINVKNARGETPLHVAAGKGEKQVAELLKSKGAK